MISQKVEGSTIEIPDDDYFTFVTLLVDRIGFRYPTDATDHIEGLDYVIASVVF